MKEEMNVLKSFWAKGERSVKNAYEHNINLYEAKKPEFQKVTRGNNSGNSIRFSRKSEGWGNIKHSEENRAVIMCAGDLMCEPAMSEAVFFENQYCFESCFKYVKPVLAESDFAIANLETMVSENAPYAHEVHKIDGRYHCNAPAKYLDALRYAGFDAFALANNHNADVGVSGLFETLSHLDERNFMRTGMFQGPEEPRYLLVNINNIRLAVFSYTLHINRNIDQELFTKNGCDVLLNRYSDEKVSRDIAAARKAGAEFLLCYIHFIGKEYSHEVTDNQRLIATKLAEAGMDCIMGSHTHSLQEHDIITTSDERNVPVIYSLGNFITSDNTSMITRSNIIYKLELRKEGDTVSINKESYIPCRIVEHTLKSGYVIFPTQGIWRQNRASKLLEEAQEKIVEIMGTSISMDGEEFSCDSVAIDSPLPFSIIRQLTLKKICQILDISVPEEFGKIENANINYITARYTWVRKGCIYFSRYLGNTEEKEARFAFQRGARVLFTSKPIFTEAGERLPCIIVNSPEYSFYKVNRWIRHLYPAKVFAITGSVGKTTTKEMLYHVVSKSFNTLKNSGNANTYAAISDTLQKLKRDNEVYIQEVCAFSPGWVKGSGYMLNPDACLITNIGYPHVDLYGSIEKILEDKISLADNLTEGGVVFLNYDDERLRTAKVSRPVISFAIHNQNADYIATDIVYKEGVIEFTINSKDGAIPACIHMYGEHNVINALAAFAVGRWLGIPSQNIVDTLETYRSEGMRQNLCNIGGYQLYMDCYNSAPNSVIGSIHTLAMMRPKNEGKKVVVFGDIPRLGKLSEEIHAKVGQDLISENIDMYLFFGPYAKYTADVLKAAGHNVHYTMDRTELNSWLKQLINRDDIILFKAGHPMALAKTTDQVFGTSFHITDGDVLLENSHDISEGEYRVRWIDEVAEIQSGDKTAPELVIPEAVKNTPVGRIGKEAFQFSKLETLLLPASLFNIGFSAFYRCEKLRLIQFSTGLKVIERSAFNGCSSLVDVSLPEGLLDIGERAFYKCKALKSIYVPDSVGHIADDAFTGCGNLTIVCHRGSYAQEYAQKQKIVCKNI